MGEKFSDGGAYRPCPRGQPAHWHPSAAEPPFRIFAGMARPKGFEPLTPRFEVWCSIQLSYGRLANHYRRNAYAGIEAFG